MATRTLLAYSTAAIAQLTGEYGGRAWLRGYTSCPYCSRTLTELGSYHRSAHNLVKTNDPPYGPAFCLACGSRDATPDEGAPAKLVDGKTFYLPQKQTEGACLFRVAVCESCGWWVAVEDADLENNGYANAVCGILEAFDVASAHVPLHVLREELPRHLHRIHGLHPQKMQQLVAEILAGVHNCDVHQVGFSRDGGIDLVLLKGDQPVAVQVKRREDPQRAEAVSGIREFLGAALIKQHTNLMYVTTAPRFSGDATKTAEAAVRLNLVRSYELVSLKKLSELLGAAPREGLWAAAIKTVRDGRTRAPTIPDPFSLRD